MMIINFFEAPLFPPPDLPPSPIRRPVFDDSSGSLVSILSGSVGLVLQRGVSGQYILLQSWQLFGVLLILHQHLGYKFTLICDDDGKL